MSEQVPESGSVQPAFPLPDRARLIESDRNGLTKREYVATMLLSGLLSCHGAKPKAFKKLAGEAIKHADELIKQIQEV